MQKSLSVLSFYVTDGPHNTYTVFNALTDEPILSDVSPREASDFLFLNEPTHPGIDELVSISNRLNHYKYDYFNNYDLDVFDSYRINLPESYSFNLKDLSPSEDWNYESSNNVLKYNSNTQLEFDFNSSNATKESDEVLDDDLPELDSE